MFVLISNQVWHSSLIFLYLINAVNFTFIIGYGTLGALLMKLINIDFPELEIVFTILFKFGSPNTSPIFVD